MNDIRRPAHGNGHSTHHHGFAAPGCHQRERNRQPGGEHTCRSHCRRPGHSA